MFLFCVVVVSILSSFAIILLVKRKRIALCHCFLAVCWLSVFCVSLSGVIMGLCVIVIFPDHSKLLIENECMHSRRSNATKGLEKRADIHFK